MDVQTREGIFGGGGYGGGVFDGGEMGFGAIGSLGLFPSPSKYPNGYPSSTYTAKPGDTGTSISKDITGNGNLWTKLLAANPSTKSAQYGMAFKPGQVLKLPAAWVASGSSTVGPAPSSTSTDTPGNVSPSPGTTAAADPGTAITAPGTSAPAQSGMSTGMMVAGLVGVGVVAAFFILRKK